MAAPLARPEVYWFDNRLQTFESKIDQPITRDQISLLISVYVGWRTPTEAVP